MYVFLINTFVCVCAFIPICKKSLHDRLNNYCQAILSSLGVFTILLTPDGGSKFSGIRGKKIEKMMSCSWRKRVESGRGEGEERDRKRLRK